MNPGIDLQRQPTRNPPAPIRVERTTLVCIDCDHPRLGLRALQRSLAQCSYDAVKLLTDDTSLAKVDDRIECVPIARIESAIHHSLFKIKGLLAHVQTDFVQVVEWDGYVTRGAAWSDDFQAYDYIGAKWWHKHKAANVGNGGFSLRSRKLLLALQDTAIVPNHPEDDVICVDYRGLLAERHDIRFAPAHVAERYAFEGTERSERELGFHGIFNLPHFNDEAELADVLEQSHVSFDHTALVSMVETLANAGRKQEALRYAKRVHAHAGYETMFREFRALLQGAVLTLVAPDEPCLCGSGQQFERCCGAFEKWLVA
jgi:hypothetical protein